MASDDIVKSHLPAPADSPLGRLKAVGNRPKTHWVEKHGTTILATCSLWEDGVRLSFRTLVRGKDLSRHHIVSWIEIESANGDTLGSIFERCLKDMREAMDAVPAP